MVKFGKIVGLVVGLFTLTIILAKANNEMVTKPTIKIHNKPIILLLLETNLWVKEATSLPVEKQEEIRLQVEQYEKMDVD